MSRDGIGVEGRQLEQYEYLMGRPSGTVLIVGPTGSGKTSTMYTMIHQLNSEQVNLLTLEDPVEYNIDGINQVQINEKTGMTFAGGLRSILRQVPDIIAVGFVIRNCKLARPPFRYASFPSFIDLFYPSCISLSMDIFTIFMPISAVFPT